MSGPSRSSLKIISWNIGGVRSKMESQVCKTLFDGFDIIMLSEIKCTYPFALPGYQCIRSSVIEGEEGRGGVAVLFKNAISTYVYAVEKHKDLISFKLKHAPALTVVAVYLPPRDSPYFSFTTLSLINEICKRDANNVLIIGDLNARMNTEQFQLPGRGITYEPNDDQQTNLNGNDVASLLKDNDLHPLNHLCYRGRQLEGALTFRKRDRWISQLDWAAVSTSAIGTVESFGVLQDTSLPSDHAPIILEMKGLDIPAEQLLARAEDLGTLEWQNPPGNRPKSIAMTKIDPRAFRGNLRTTDELWQMFDQTDNNILCNEVADSLYTTARKSTWKETESLEVRTREELSSHQRWKHLLDESDSKKLWMSIAWNGDHQQIDSNSCHPSDESFCAYYAGLLQAETAPTFTPGIPKYIPVLDDPIEPFEVEQAIRRLKSNKAPGADGIAPGILKILDDEWKVLITHTFNSVFSGEYPACWQEARVISIYKKGDRLKPENYRGISIMNALAKLYDLILSRRFIQWYRPSEEQAGAQRGRGCDEHILTLRLVVDVARKKKRPLYLCFIDFEKAYDRVNRTKLMQRLDSIGCGTKFLTALQKSYTRTSGVIGDHTFDASAGVRQGACTSCPLFTCLVDVVVENVKAVEDDDWLGNLHLLLLMDDTVVLSTSRPAMEEKLSRLHDSVTNIGMKINAAKSKILTVCSNDKEPFFLGEISIQSTDKYQYLGTPITDATIKEQMLTHLEQKKPQTLKFAAFLHKNCDAPFQVKRKVWQAALLSSIFYSSESWLCHDLRPAEHLYITSLKQMMGVRTTTCTDLVLVEAGEPDACELIRRRQRRFITKLMNREDHLNTHVGKVMQMAMQARCPAGIALEKLLQDPEERSLDQRQSAILESDSSRRMAYRTVNPTLQRAAAYRDGIEERDRVAFTRLRLSSHNLIMERGRWNRVPRDQRLCLCGELQTEAHVLLSCDHTRTARDHHSSLDFTSLENLFSGPARDVAALCRSVLELFP